MAGRRRRNSRGGFEGEGFAALMLLIIALSFFFVPDKRKPSEPKWLTVLRWGGRMALLALASYGLWSLHANGHI